MNSTRHCHLLLPGLNRPAGAAAPDLPALQAMLGYGRPVASFAGDAEAWLCQFFGIVPQHDWPSAAFSALGDDLPAQEGYWLCVQPLHLQLQRDQLVAIDAAQGLNDTQARQLITALNTHFSADGMLFYAPPGARSWYLRLDAVPDLHTTPLNAVLGRAVDTLLPRGTDGLRWHARLNEMQMLLHAHPLNWELEQGGGLPVNSLWLWGGGILLPGPAPTSVQVWADAALARGLARAQRADVQPLPKLARDWLKAAAPGNHLVVLDRGQMTVDPQAWQRAWLQLERDWFAPLLQALRSGGVRRISLHLADAGKLTSFDLARGDVWKFWRRGRPLEVALG